MTIDIDRLSECFRDLAVNRAVLSVAAQLLGTTAVSLHNAILWCKPARVGSAKPLHQDAAYLDPPVERYITFWIAIDRADEANGCLHFVPGSHRRGAILHTSPEPCVDEAKYSGQLRNCELMPAEAVVFHPCVLHGSRSNESSRSRRAVMFRYRRD